MRKILVGLVLTVVVSFYVFPISFTFLPNAINSKILVGVFGIFAFILNGIRKNGIYFSEPTIVGAVMASLFSVWCLYSITGTSNYNTIYADYIVSYATWLAGAYGVYAALSLEYEKVDLEIITRYLALVGVFQCVTAVLIDNYGGFQSFVDRWMDLDQDFLHRGNRMYGIGAALDPGGIRFAVILVMIAHQFSTNLNVRNNSLYQTSDLVAFATITIIGSVISRTTTIGAGLGIAYIIIALFRMRRGGFVTLRMIRRFFWFILVMVGITVAAVYFYRSSATFKEYLRFGFEAFFNWVETGEFRTDSTDVLMERMWIWPTDLHTWIFGRGTFGIYENNTDIGYCNFTLYCGLVGMVIFSIFFLYCHLVQNRKYKEFLITSWLLIALTFIVWVKVTTDIFFIDALLFCAVGDYEDAPEPDESHLPKAMQLYNTDRNT